MNLKGLNGRDVDYLEQWEAQVHVTHDLDPAEKFLFRHSVMRILANEFRGQGRRRIEDGWYDPTPTNAEVAHIVDWLRADLLTSAPWLENIDERGRPRKLLKCRNVDDLMREADKSMDRRNGGPRAKALGPDDEAVVADLGRGYTLVRMLTPEALDVESERMHHCVGHGSYDGLLASGWGRLLSVRNRKGRPVATIELREEGNGFWSIRQLEGRHNRRPAPEVMDVLRAYAVERDWRERHFWWPTVTLEDGSECDVDRIPDGATIMGFLSFTGLQERYPDFTLPERLTVLGDLIFPPLTMVPEGLTVRGVIEFTRRIQGDPLLRLPESLVAKEIRVVSLDDLARPIPEHLVPLIKVRSWKYSDIVTDDEPEAPRP